MKEAVPEKVTSEPRPGGNEGAGGAEGTTSARVLRGNPLGVFLDIKEPWDADKAFITGFGT